MRVEKRASELKAFKAQAESATKAEKWDEAVSAWESYLALEPEDGAGVEGKLQHARKYAKIAGDYAEAQEAIRKKRYGRAIELLQGIIAQEPTYKSTSRLLVEAVEANKAIPFWRRPWVLPAVGVVALAVLGIFFGPQAWNAISTAIADRPIAAVEAPIAVDETEPATAAVITPTPTLDPDIQIALDIIQNEAPVYQTSFDFWDFEDTGVSTKIEMGGRLSPVRIQEHAGVNLSNLSSDRFAVEFELRILESHPGGHRILKPAMSTMKLTKPKEHSAQVSGRTDCQDCHHISIRWMNM